jgi:hypothetical protein
MQDRNYASLGYLGTLSFLVALWTGVTPAAPVIQGVSGALNHNATITISGSGFGTKSTAVPLLWDDASTGTSITEKWSGAWPDMLPGYNTGYYAPMRGVPLPHSHATRYIAGSHASNNADTGIAVILYKNISAPAMPYYVYASWYQRLDPQWHFGGDNNTKTFDWSYGTGPYNNPKSWYICYGPPHPSSATDNGVQWTYENGTPLQNPDQNGHIAWWGRAVNPVMAWSKVEIAIKVTNDATGYVNIWEDGKQVMKYVGITDNYGGTPRSIGIGGYARMYNNPTNWRYFDDVYIDTTLSRVVLADTPVLSNATIVENQIPTAWGASSITAKVNLGKFTQGQTAYLFVVDSSGTTNAAGLAVTADGQATLKPNAPAPFSVQ